MDRVYLQPGLEEFSFNPLKLHVDGLEEDSSKPR